MYKIITNILVFHLQKSLPSLISENQGAFASGRRAIDQILIAKGMLHVIKKRKKSIFAIKLDIEKASTLYLGILCMTTSRILGSPLSP